MRTATVVLAVMIAMLVPATVRAQNLAAVLPTALENGVTMTSSVAVAGNPHEAHFIAALGAGSQPWPAINKLIVEQVNTFPIGSSSGGFVFTFDPATGLFKPASQSFGSTFAERALTNGRGRWGFGLNYQHLEFKSFEGVDLQNGSFQYVLQHNDCCAVAGNPTPDPEDPFFEGDVVNMALSLQIKSDVVDPFVSYGVTSRWDVGVVVPIVKVQLSPTVTSTIVRLSTAANPLIHSWDGNGQTTKIFPTLGGSASGIGDVLLRTKYRFVDFEQGGLAAGLEVRLPTGDKENLLGTGGVQTKLLFIASGEVARVSPHVNVGYTFSHGEISSAAVTLPTTPLSGSSTTANAATAGQINSEAGIPLADTHLSNEFNYVGGVDVAVHSLLTVSGDLVGRTLMDSQRFAMVAQNFQFRTANNGALQSTSIPTFTNTGSGSLNTLLGVVGAKFNIPGTSLLLTGNVLFPLTDAGLRAKVTPVVGLDYSFGK